MNKILIISLLLVTNICLSQTGIGIEKPEADLDINVLTKFSNLPDVSSKLSEYKTFLYIDNLGYIGGKEKVKGEENYSYRTSYFQTMSVPLSFSFLNSLGLEKTIVIPPYTNSLIEVNYSIPAMNGNYGNASVLLSKIENTDEVFIYESARTFTYAQGYAQVLALGRAISNVYYDEIKNDTDSPITLTYKLYGNTTSGGKTRFGMYGTASNFNWGYGSLNINVFDY